MPQNLMAVLELNVGEAGCLESARLWAGDSRIMSWRSENIPCSALQAALLYRQQSSRYSPNYHNYATNSTSPAFYLIIMSISPIITFKAGACDFDVSILAHLMCLPSGPIFLPSEWLKLYATVYFNTSKSHTESYSWLHLSL